MCVSGVVQGSTVQCESITRSVVALFDCCEDVLQSTDDHPLAWMAMYVQARLDA